MKTLPVASLKKGLLHAARTTVAVLISILVAQAIGMPEYYWAPISTVIIMQCVLGVVQIVSWQQLVGTALGSSMGALLATVFGLSLAAYLGGVFAIGLLCAALRLDRTAYRFAGVTLTVIMLIPHTGPIWMTAFHRFAEVALGIVVAVIVTVAWPEPETEQVKELERKLDDAERL